ncbi:MAG: DinB family protein [Roseivirga sp.]|nr:DinB family protein [Roseivirga sp.]
MSYTPEDGFPYYLDLVKDIDCQSLFTSTSTFDLLSSLTEEQGSYRYAADKWSIKQVVGHITDHERIKIPRAFFTSRGQSIELWGYDQNSLVANSRFNELTLKELVTDYMNVRKASASFVGSLSDSQLRIRGQARQYEVSLEDFLRSIIGHETHHINIIKERYLS